MRHGKRPSANVCSSCSYACVFFFLSPAENVFRPTCEEVAHKGPMLHRKVGDDNIGTNSSRLIQTSLSKQLTSYIYPYDTVPYHFLGWIPNWVWIKRGEVRNATFHLMTVPKEISTIGGSQKELYALFKGIH